MTNPVLEARQLTKDYADGRRQTRVLNAIDLVLHRGESMAIVGPSGSGKSTLLHLLGSLDKPTSGVVLGLGQDLAALSETARSLWRNQHLGFVYQFHHLLPEFTAQENVMMPLCIAGESPKLAVMKANELLAEVGLADCLEARVQQLSGGERQRVAIARAIVMNPTCLLVDEPTGNLDHKTAGQVVDRLLQLNDTHQIALIFVTHDRTLAQTMQKVYHLEDGVLSAL